LKTHLQLKEGKKKTIFENPFATERKKERKKKQYLKTHLQLKERKKEKTIFENPFATERNKERKKEKTM
jgi:hypothetical protein